MEKQSFKVTINAPREKVWYALWNNKTYVEWTSVFSPGPFPETDWKEGSKILFLDNKGQGMVSRIAKKKDNEFMSFEHLGVVLNGVEETSGQQAQEWSGAKENYTLKEVNGKTELTVELDITDEFKDYFLKTWPKALEKLKSIVEESKKSLVA